MKSIGLVQNWHHHIIMSSNVTRSRHDISEKLLILALNNIQPLTLGHP